MATSLIEMALDPGPANQTAAGAPNQNHWVQITKCVAVVGVLVVVGSSSLFGNKSSDSNNSAVNISPEVLSNFLKHQYQNPQFVAYNVDQNNAVPLLQERGVTKEPRSKKPKKTKIVEIEEETEED